MSLTKALSREDGFIQLTREEFSDAVNKIKKMDVKKGEDVTIDEVERGLLSSLPKPLVSMISHNLKQVFGKGSFSVILLTSIPMLSFLRASGDGFTGIVYQVALFEQSEVVEDDLILSEIVRQEVVRERNVEDVVRTAVLFLPSPLGVAPIIGAYRVSESLMAIEKWSLKSEVVITADYAQGLLRLSWKSLAIEKSLSFIGIEAEDAEKVVKRLETMFNLEIIRKENK